MFFFSKKLNTNVCELVYKLESTVHIMNCCVYIMVYIGNTYWSESWFSQIELSFYIKSWFISSNANWTQISTLICLGSYMHIITYDLYYLNLLIDDGINFWPFVLFKTLRNYHLFFFSCLTSKSTLSLIFIYYAFAQKYFRYDELLNMYCIKKRREYVLIGSAAI